MFYTSGGEVFQPFKEQEGVLRILALVVHSLKDSKNPFIRLGDFDLKNNEIRKELIKYIGQNMIVSLLQTLLQVMPVLKR